MRDPEPARNGGTGTRSEPRRRRTAGSLRTGGPSRVPDPQVVDRRLGEPDPRPAMNADQGEPKRTMSAATSPFRPRSAPVSTVNGVEGAARTAASAARPPTSPKVSATSLDRQTEKRAPSGRRRSPAAPAVAGTLEGPGSGAGEKRREADHEERAHLDARPGDGDDPVAANLVEGRIREDVGGPREDGSDHAVQRECDRERRSNPAERRPAGGRAR